MIVLAAFLLRSASTISVDLSIRHPISKYIYGVNFPDWEKMDVPFTLARQGGNRLTAYNWETNASNAGNDWHNQNDGLMGATDEPGWAVRTFVQPAQAHGAAALVTVPTAGYVAADKKGDGDVNQTPDYLNVRFLKSYAHKPGGNYVYPPDTTDRAVYQDEFVAWVEKMKSPKTPVWFMLDNEPDIWAGTHSRIVTKPVTYAGIIANNIDFASAIKSAAPNTLVFGPANYGWNGFRTFQGAPDANGRDFLDVYLAAMKEAGEKAGKRLLDVLDVHWYPEAQGGGVRIVTENDKPGTPEARIQAPRSLWDPSYVETSWITQSLGGKPIALLPRIEKQIADYYPGIRLSISEYQYGGNKVISGAIAEADVLGVYGRYGLFAACNWGLGTDDKGEIAGFRAFLDYDGHGGHFGDVGLGVSGETPSDDSVYASVDSKDPRKLTLVVINKTDAARRLSFDLGRAKATSPQAFTATSASLPNLVSSEVTATDGRLLFDAPPESVTTIAARLER